MLEPYLSVHEDPKQKQEQMASKMTDLKVVAKVSSKPTKPTKPTKATKATKLPSRLEQRNTTPDITKEKMTQEIVPFDSESQQTRNILEHRLQLSGNSGTTSVGTRLELHDGKVSQNGARFDIAETMARLKEEVVAEKREEEFEERNNINGSDPQVLCNVSDDVGDFRKRLYQQGKKLLNQKHANYQLPFPVSSSSSSSSLLSSSASPSSSNKTTPPVKKLSKKELHTALVECLFELSSQEMEDFVGNHGYKWVEYNAVPLDSTKTELVKIRDNLLQFKLESWALGIQASSRRCNEVAKYMAKFCLSEQEQERIFKSFAHSASAQVRSSYGTMDEMLANPIVDYSEAVQETPKVTPIANPSEQQQVVVVADLEQKGNSRKRKQPYRKKTRGQDNKIQSLDPRQEYSLRLLESKKLGEMKQVREDVEMDREAMGRFLEQALGHFDQRLITLNSSVGSLDSNIQTMDANVRDMRNSFGKAGRDLATAIKDEFAQMRQEMKESLQRLREEWREELQSTTLVKPSTSFRCIQ